MCKTGEAESAHQRGGPENVHHVVHIEAESRTLLTAYAGQGSIHAVAEPVEDQAEVHQQQEGVVVAR